MSKTYKYPLNITSSPSTLPSDAMSRGATTDYLIIYVLDTSSAKDGFNPFQSFGKSNAKSFAQEGSIVGRIYLHMPNQIQSNYQVSYQDKNLGAIGAAAVSAITGGEGVTPEGIEQAAKSMAPEIAANALGTALSAANSLTGVGGDALSGSDLSVLTQRKAFNPYKENVFQGVPFRQHSFNIKMVPRNQQEADQIKGIVGILKYAMHPAFSAGAGIGGIGGGGNSGGIASTRWLDLPYSFGLEFKRLGNDSSVLLYKFKPSVLTALNVDYTPDGNYVTGRSDGNFNDHGLAVNLQMTFKETQIVTKEDIGSDFSKVTY